MTSKKLQSIGKTLDKVKIFDNVEKLIPYNSEEIITDKIQSLIQELTPTMPNNVKELIPANKDIQITIEPPSNTFKYDTKKNSLKNFSYS